MRILSNLPREIKSSGHLFRMEHYSLKEGERRGSRYRTIKVLNKNLVGVKDLYGKLYTPITWKFIEVIKE